jgi:Ser/Thr protein kinase RdoA (MazF antagonist)
VDRLWLARLAAEFGGSGELRTAASPSGAVIAYAGPVVVKVHHVRTDPTLLRARLLAAADLRLADVLVAPVSTAVHPAPDGRSTTIWPCQEVLSPTEDRPPWAAAGRLLARLHRAEREPIASLPALSPVVRLQRALSGVPSSAGDASLLLRVGSGIVAEAATAPAGRQLVHGDWHLGQLGRDPGGGWRLLDIDDLGRGDPVWDLARPAGFWAAGLLSNADWDAFMTAYRGADGPAVPTDGDPWSRLDLPARAAVVAAACRATKSPEADGTDIAEALFEACRRM